MSPCRVMKLKDGAMAIVCSRGSRSNAKPCYVCGQPSRFLCDYPVTKRLVAKGPMEYPNTTTGTCDKPMCERCRNNVGENRDYCNAHFRLSRKEDPTP